MGSVSHHPQAVVFTDPTVAALAEAAHAAVESYPKHILPRMADDKPQAWKALYTALRNWPYKITGSCYIDYTDKKRLLQAISDVHDIAIGENPNVNKRAAEDKGWCDVLLSPKEQELIENHRKDILAGGIVA